AGLPWSKTKRSTSAVFPMPASPLTNAMRPGPALTCSQAPVNFVNCCSRSMSSIIRKLVFSPLIKLPGLYHCDSLSLSALTTRAPPFLSQILLHTFTRGKALEFTCLSSENRDEFAIGRYKAFGVALPSCQVDTCIFSRNDSRSLQ